MSEAEHQIETAKVNSDTDAKLVRMEEEMRKEKEPEQRDSEQKMKGEAQDERKEHDPATVREGDKEDKRKRVDFKDEEKDVKEEVDAKRGEKHKKLEKSSKNWEKGEEGKKEKKDKSESKANSNSWHPEGEKSEAKEKKKDKKKEEKKKEETKEENEEKKKEKEEKKKEKKERTSKSSSERIEKKLEKINAKIGRILAKKEEYELRLKEALERERQESQKAVGTETSTTVTEKSANDSPGLRSEESIVTDQLRLVDDASAKESNKKSAELGLSGSLSRTESLVEAPPSELMEEVASQKKVVEKLSKLAVRDGSEGKFIKDPDVVMTGTGEVLKHTLQVDDSKDIGTS